MGFLGVILTIIISLVVGFIFGTLVYRNNAKKLKKLTDSVIDLKK